MSTEAVKAIVYWQHRCFLGNEANKALKAENAKQAEQLRRNLHEESAASANTIKLLQERIKDKDKAIRAAAEMLEQALKE